MKKIDRRRLLLRRSISYTYRVSEFVRHAVRKSRDHFHCALPLFEVAVARPRVHVESHFRVFAYNSCRRDLPTVIMLYREKPARVSRHYCCCRQAKETYVQKEMAEEEEDRKTGGRGRGRSIEVKVRAGRPQIVASK